MYAYHVRKTKSLSHMDPAKLVQLENILRFHGLSLPLVSDAAVLSCGCLVSESAFIQSGQCPLCSSASAIVSAVKPLRDLHRLIEQFRLETRPHRKLSLRSGIETQKPDTTDLVGLFYKYAKEEMEKSNPAPSQTQSKRQSQMKNDNQSPTKAISIPATGDSGKSKSISSSPEERFFNSTVERQRTAQTQNSEQSLLIIDSTRLHILMGLSEKEEYNFSRCFPFHRKHTSFQTQQNRFGLKSRSFLNKNTKFCCTDIVSRPDPATQAEITTFALISEKGWELYKLVDGRPKLAACGKSTGEYGPLATDMELPKDHGVVIRNEFSGTANSDKGESDETASRLKSWVQLYCRLSERYLVISGTRGVVRVLNVDPQFGPVGSPVYTYITNFPIRCIAIAPNQSLIACGITALERISSKQQPFIILHKLDYDSTGKVLIRPVTITVPFRDPLKTMNFNASSSHLLACTVYEMRYFIVRLRLEHSVDYSRPRLIWNDTRLGKPDGTKRRGTNDTGKEDSNTVPLNEDDAMLDNEGITAIKFGVAFTNTVVITSSSLKNRPPIVLKLNGPALDYGLQLLRTGSDGYESFYHQNYDTLYQDMSATTPTTEPSDKSTIEDVEVVMKVPEVGSSIYNVEISPRGDGMVFVDKLGKLYLVSSNVQLGQRQLRNRVVLLGESADAYRYSESTTVRFSSDGGKVYAVDRRGLIQVFDFTKGVPGEDLDVIKCKIISV